MPNGGVRATNASMSSTDETSLRIVPPGARKLGKHQQRFNTLIKKVTRIRRLIAEWTDATPALHRAVAEHDRLRREYFARLGDLVRLFDTQLAGDGLSARDKKLLGHLLADLSRQLLEHAPTDDIKALYNRHTRGNFDAETERERAAQLHMMKSLLEDELGVELGGTKLQSLDELEAEMTAALEQRDREAAEQAEREAARRASKKKTAKQAAREAARERDKLDTSKSLQEIFRKLALAMHPDHEQDPDERVRKTLLMQELNAAYESGDLLKLLELQLRYEQVDRAHIDNLADERLVHFNRLLVEQVAQLERELASAEAAWRYQLEVPGYQRIAPPHVLAAIRVDLTAFARDIARVRRDLDTFTDARALSSWLADQRVRRSR